MNIQFQVDSAPVLGPLLVLFATGTVVQVRRGAWDRRRALLQLAAAVYVAAVLSLTIFPLNMVWGDYANQASWISQINFIPLLTADITMVPNVIMMVPAGFLLPLVFRHATSASRATLMTAAASLAVEAAQLLSYLVLNNGRAVDVNDLLANTLGGLIGYALVVLALRAPALRRPLLAASLPRSAARQDDRRRTVTVDGPRPAPIAAPVVRP
ncbi:VanZ like protein [Streptomyces brevispora]|uniref:VanZ like protein n=1 Tax=Streptomyces brevispora TaxID=887462 RepID=A0A561US02_9ACTN|nr:VanZ family protein [Streptomyces brevispora]TWG02152.1 VanZ like protein [Streptomyces brevispora]